MFSPSVNNSYSSDFFIIVLAIVIIGIVIESVFNKKRIEEIEKYASSHGLGFIKEPKSFINCNVQFSVNDLYRPHLRSYYYQALLSGQRDDIKIQITDYSYTIGYGRGSRTQHLTLCLLQKRGAKFPDFRLHKADFVWNYFGRKYGEKSIVFEDDVFFSDSFALFGPNENAIKKFFDPEVRKVFMDHKYLDLSFEAKKNYLLVIAEDFMDYKERLKIISISFKIFNRIST